MYKRLITIVLILAILTTAMTGCSGGNEISIIKKPTVKADTIGDEVVDANSQFAFDIFKAVYNSDKKGNVFLSPASISTALAMTLNGAVGNTYDEMSEILGFEKIESIMINNGFAYLVEMLNRDENGVRIALANSIWIREGFPVLDEFKKTNTDYFAAAIQDLDFSEPGAADIINGWVKDNTEGLIDSIVDDKIDPLTIMFLINTIYFKGNWKVEFDPDKTYESDFRINGTIAGKVNMMTDKSDILYYEADDFKIVSLPYSDKSMFMDLILPSEETDLDEFVNQFGIDEYKDALANIHERHDVVLAIPKFKSEYELSLKDALISLGMEEPFSGAADFTRMNENGNIFISDVKHKTYIDVNEKGTEAAAVTSVEMKLTAIMDPLEFIANRPFIYIIRDSETGSILFMGVFDTPS